MIQNFQYAAFSFGGGVQSTALLLLIKHEPQRLLDAVGHLPNKAYFADTGAESEEIYHHLEQMRALSSISLETVSNGSLTSWETQNGTIPRSFPPYFTRNKDASIGMLLRKCTSEFKVKPLQRAIRHDIGLSPGRRSTLRSVALWLGISIDEAHRMSDNSTKLFQNIYPLIELGWDRTRCFSYCQEHGITPSKSRCFFCPYVSDWLDIKRNQPKEFAKAVEFDKQIRNVVRGGVKGEVFLHKSCKPLDEAIENQGHLWEGYPADFGNECTGICGV